MYPWGFTYAAMGPHKDKLQQTIKKLDKVHERKKKALRCKQMKNSQWWLKLFCIAKEQHQSVEKKSAFNYVIKIWKQIVM